MQQSYLQFQIAQLRQQNQTRVMESIMVLILNFVFVSLVPQFLMIYVFQAQNSLMQQPPAFIEYMPVVATIITLIYLVFAIVTNMMRENKARGLEAELKTIEMMEDSTNFGSTDEELMALEKIVDDALEQHTMNESKATKKAPVKKAAKKKAKK